MRSVRADREVNMTINFERALERLSDLDRQRAQLELLVSQLKEKKLKLEEDMKALGVDPTNIDEKILELEKDIARRLSDADGQSSDEGDRTR